MTAGQGGEKGARSHGKLEGARPLELCPHSVLSLSLHRNAPQTQSQALGAPKGPAAAAAMAAATRKRRLWGHWGLERTVFPPRVSPLQRGCESREEPGICLY